MKMTKMNQQLKPLFNNKRASHYFAFRARNVEYFNFNSNIFIIKMKKNHNIYYNVFNFINRLRMKINIINIIMFKQNLNVCLLNITKQ